MKLFTYVFCAALTTIWAMPVSAFTFDEEMDFVITINGLEEVRSESIVIADDPAEFGLYDADLWGQLVELTNADVTSNSGSLAVRGYDAGGSQLAQTIVNFALHQPDPNVLEFVVLIDGDDVATVNAFVSNLSGNPNTKSIGFTPMIPVECIAPKEDVEIEAFHTYDGNVEASDDATLPGSFACPTP